MFLLYKGVLKEKVKNGIWRLYKVTEGHGSTWSAVNYAVGVDPNK